ncbi:hypothetical protein [Aquabacterium sp.]|jgi:hypothetical protein|uniref:hypothetical protein n=1 Tax=Aquabacterium sp. TaxID=1872578 RepID=UPI0025C66ED3|nr:hypothetical protein [Aquabacterium sp.]
MWKMLVGFVVFAVIAVFLLIKSGADVDMGGEKHGIDTSHSEEAKAAPSDAAPASAPASAASN